MFTTSTPYITKHGLDLSEYDLYITNVSFHNNSNWSSTMNPDGTYPTAVVNGYNTKAVNYQVQAYVPGGLANGLNGLPVTLSGGQSAFTITANLPDSLTVQEAVDLAVADFLNLVS